MSAADGPPPEIDASASRPPGSPPIVCVVGRSNSGKTTLMRGLIVELVARGVRVATVKHSSHGFDLDREGKDSWHHARAGSECVILTSPDKLAVIRDVEREPGPAELASFLPEGIELLLVEGYKSWGFPRIEVHRHGFGDPLFDPGERLALVTDLPPDEGAGAAEDTGPCFGHGEVAAIADLVEARVLGRPG